VPLAQASSRAHDAQSLPASKDIEMKWETPRAIELRFGMEITMYVANR